MTDESQELLKGTLDMLILQALERGPMHGWGVAERIETSSRDVFRLQTGTLYPSLHRLLRQGHIAAEWQTTENNRRARYYRLTPARAQAPRERSRLVGTRERRHQPHPERALLGVAGSTRRTECHRSAALLHRAARDRSCARASRPSSTTSCATTRQREIDRQTARRERRPRDARRQAALRMGSLDDRARRRARRARRPTRRRSARATAHRLARTAPQRRSHHRDRAVARDSASAARPPSSASSTRCCCGRCPIPTPTACTWCASGGTASRRRCRRRRLRRAARPRTAPSPRVGAFTCPTSGFTMVSNGGPEMLQGANRVATSCRPCSASRRSSAAGFSSRSRGAGSAHLAGPLAHAASAAPVTSSASNLVLGRRDPHDRRRDAGRVQRPRRAQRPARGSRLRLRAADAARSVLSAQ